MNIYKIQYQAGPYKGTIEVIADDGEIAMRIAKRKIRKQMSLPMYSESYKIISREPLDD